MAASQSKPFGLWPSPISPEFMSGAIRLEDVQIDEDGTVVWLESADGKTQLMAQSGIDAPRSLAPGFKVGGSVGYGGGDFTIRGGKAVFVSKNRLYSVGLMGGQPTPFTPEFGEMASPVISPNGQYALFISSIDRADCLAMVKMDGSKWPVKLASGADFYMQPVWHPNGNAVAWIEWDHPNMPWDGCRLMLGELVDDSNLRYQQIDGGPAEAVFQPVFSPDGHYLVYARADGNDDVLILLDLETLQKRTLAKGKCLIEPAWIQGLRSIAWDPGSTSVYYLVNTNNKRSLERISLATGQVTATNVAPYSWIKQIDCAIDGSLVFIAANPQTPDRVVKLNPNGSLQVLKRSTPENIPDDYLQDPQPIEWKAPDGSVVHGLYYAPRSPLFTSPGLPPAVISIHGGPTSARVWEHNSQSIFFTSRGFAYLEVNHRGSSGYGRDYMYSLRKNWGKLDVEDAAGGAAALGELGLADKGRIAIMGGSAGGYTVLNSLIHYPAIFKVGINFYGVANLFDFLIGTHKFEERYNDSLVGTLPEAAEKFKTWSPIFHADKITNPVAIFQGEIDKVVPRDHSDQIVTVLKTNHVPHIYRLYEGEGHGFRKAQTIADFYNNINQFLLTYLLF